ncbi:MAG: sigma-70 family RNA polymerase sigma factor [Paludibacteraceae bacterium]|nr:sigma-70 family RNA polymerase sigma factor [Paludibacteraceae bacterium]
MKRTTPFARLEEVDSYFREIEGYEPLTSEEERELALRIREGDDLAVDKLVKSNVKFVVSVAKQYRNSGVPFSDLISEGNYGLVKAARKFDPDKGVRFISYAVWWIRNSLQECVEQYLGKLNEVDGADYVFDNTVKADYGSSFPQTEMPDTNFMEEQGRNAGIEDLMSNLKKREVDILTAYFGLDGRDEMTLEEIGDEFKLTKERVRQIKDKALSKMRVNALMSDEFDVYSELR